MFYVRRFALLSVGVCLAALSPAAEAQHLHFSFGGHGNHHGHHRHHCWDDPYWYVPHYDYVYVAPPPVVRRHVTYVQPAEEIVETRVQLPPRTTVSPRISPAAARTTSQSPLQIWNSAEQRVPVAFLVDSEQVELADGQSHTFYGGQSRTITYDRGGEFGTARQQFDGGEYEFVITGRGWDLIRRDRTAGVVPQPVVKKNALPLR
ncbi:MAG: hypothetical protein WD872_08110 [Pirellulaceae bacterium]